MYLLVFYLCAFLAMAMLAPVKRTIWFYEAPAQRVCQWMLVLKKPFINSDTACRACLQAQKRLRGIGPLALQRMSQRYTMRGSQPENKQGIRNFQRVVRLMTLSFVQHELIVDAAGSFGHYFTVFLQSMGIFSYM